MTYAELVGDPVDRSASPAIHRFWIERLAIAGDYRARAVSREGLALHLRTRRGDRSWRGCNVTMPLKEEAYRLVDELSPTALSIGSVNLITNQRGALVGHNSDWIGFLRPLRAHLVDGHPRTAVVIGTGGAARAIVWSLVLGGFSIQLLSRDVTRARALLEEYKLNGAHTARPLGEGLAPVGVPSLLVNATPLGMESAGELELDLRTLPAHALVCDIVYEPLETGLLKAARQRGLRTLDGLHMLIGQAAVSFQSFFGTAPPRELDSDLRERLIR